GIRDFHVTGVQTCALPILPKTLAVSPVSESKPTRAIATPPAMTSPSPRIPAMIWPTVERVRPTATRRVWCAVMTLGATRIPTPPNRSVDPPLADGVGVLPLRQLHSGGRLRDQLRRNVVDHFHAG